MFEQFNAESTRREYEREIAAVTDIARYMPKRPTMTERLAARRVRRSTR